MYGGGWECRNGKVRTRVRFVASGRIGVVGYVAQLRKGWVQHGLSHRIGTFAVRRMGMKEIARGSRTDLAGLEMYCHNGQFKARLVAGAGAEEAGNVAMDVKGLKRYVALGTNARLWLVARNGLDGSGIVARVGGD